MVAINVGIVGGGPAGAYCAYELAKKSINVTIFDHSHPREKPCGGGVTSLTPKKFPFLENVRPMGNAFADFKVISCTNREVVFRNHQKGFYISRRLLDQEILDMAVRSGARLVREKVVGVRRDQSSWRIDTTQNRYTARILVGADGAGSIVRRETVGPIPKGDLGLTYGYYVTGMRENITIVKYLTGMPGYIWLFPRKDEASVGIGSELRFGSVLQQSLDQFMSIHCPTVKVTSKFAALLPSASDPAFFELPCAGEDWLLIGDAAGHVDPITGEGIPYALWSASLAAQAIDGSDPEAYDGLWRKEYGGYLIECCKRKCAFYNPLAIDMSVVSILLNNANLEQKG